MQELRLEDGMSPTRGIYHVLKPYWDRGVLTDEHWAYVRQCIHKIETRCVECREEMIIRAL